jgi:hypothetical protein
VVLEEVDLPKQGENGRKKINYKSSMEFHNNNRAREGGVGRWALYSYLERVVV